MWSHDGYETNAQGTNVPNNMGQHPYCDQVKAWNLMGESVLDKAWKGLNNTIFAYGQTGAGKSYTTFGYPGNEGIVPQAARRIYERINTNPDPNIKFQVSVQMVEIYMEKIQDLLVPPKKRGNPLQIKQSKSHVYVAGAKKIPCNSYDDIKNAYEEGESNRTIGSTQMNATSSRAHTVLTIEFTKISTFNGKSG